MFGRKSSANWSVLGLDLALLLEHEETVCTKVPPKMDAQARKGSSTTHGSSRQKHQAASVRRASSGESGTQAFTNLRVVKWKGVKLHMGSLMKVA